MYWEAPYWLFQGATVGESHGELLDGDDDVPDFAEGKLGGALELDGIGEYVEINPDNEPLFDGFDENGDQTGFTVSAWFKVRSFEKSWQALVAKGEGNRWRIHRRGGESIMTGNGGNADVSPGNISVDDEEWHHLALISTPDEGVELYVDGELEGSSGAPNLQDNDLPMAIGENPDARGRTWNGWIDDLAFWDRPLEPEEVLKIWNNGDGASIADLSGNVSVFQITEVNLIKNGEAAVAEISWPARAGQSFRVERSTNLQNWEEVTDGFEAEGDLATFELDLPAPVPDELYLRVSPE